MKDAADIGKPKLGRLLANAANSLFALLLVAAQPSSIPGPRQVWRWRSGQLANAESDPLMQVGSIQKPFVIAAWAEAHPADAPPVIECTATSHCWRISGHGRMGLADALSNSCNAYFLELANQTPMETLRRVFKEAGFQGRISDADAAIGLGSHAPKIRPSKLFKAFHQLMVLPWERDELRKLLVHGLREAAMNGTAKLGRPGYLAKTGTVPGRLPDTTTGLAIAFDGSGNGVLARQEGMTGRGVAALLFSSGRAERLEGMVRLSIFELLGRQPVQVKNLEAYAIPCSKGFLGAGAAMEINPGDEVGPGLLEIHLPRSSLRRCFYGQLFVGPMGRLTATMSEREYVSGVVNAELRQGQPEQLRVELGAAAIRYLKQPPRHEDADVCDSTHCAWFIGRGPRLDWSLPSSAKEVGPALPPIGDGLWDSIALRSKSHGPTYWSSHCGGKPLSPYALWGSGPAEPMECIRHREPALPWERSWDVARLEKAIGEQISSVQIIWPKGQWMLRFHTATRKVDFNYDSAHRLLAGVAGWGALPSPADSARMAGGKIIAQGHGLGHRVGLCLGD
jgi:hypothetical protein